MAHPLEEVRATVDAYVAVRERIEAGDATWLDLADFFTDDVVYIDPAWGRVQGLVHIREFLVDSMVGLEDWSFPIEFTAIDGDTAQVGPGIAKRLDLLALGDRSARHVGVNVDRLRLGVIVLVTLLVASGVAFAGIIAFVGLVVPHAMRVVIGNEQRWLLPASVLLYRRLVRSRARAAAEAPRRRSHRRSV